MGKTWKKDKTGGNFSRNKKSKFTKGEKKEFKPPNKRGRLVLRNLPFKVSFNKIQEQSVTPNYHNKRIIFIPHIWTKQEFRTKDSEKI